MKFNNITGMTITQEAPCVRFCKPIERDVVRVNFYPMATPAAESPTKHTLQESPPNPSPLNSSLTSH